MEFLLYFIAFYFLIALVFLFYIKECEMYDKSGNKIDETKCRIIVSVLWLYVLFKAIKDKKIKLKGFNNESN